MLISDLVVYDNHHGCGNKGFWIKWGISSAGLLLTGAPERALKDLCCVVQPYTWAIV